MIATFTTIPVVATVMFIVRLYVQSKLVKQGLRTWETTTAAIGLILFLSFCGLLIISALHGVGHHWYEISLAEFKLVLTVRILSWTE